MFFTAKLFFLPPNKLHALYILCGAGVSGVVDDLSWQCQCDEYDICICSFSLHKFFRLPQT